MRRIVGQVTPEITRFIGSNPLDKNNAYPIPSYRELVEHIAKLAYLNKDHLLFFRGQGVDYRSQAGASTFYPSIYRGNYVRQIEIIRRFELLDHAARKLKDVFRKHQIPGHEELVWKRYIQWGVLQHYQVCQTPLFDLTHSLRVACSFAQLFAQHDSCFVYVFGLPYVTNRISHHSEHDIVNIRLLSICPPQALRPHFQEGYLSGTEDITSEYDSKDKLDFRNRLIAKFSIPASNIFWGKGFSRIPENVLFPENDRIEQVCREIKTELKSQLLPGQLGIFIQEWSDLENLLLSRTRDSEQRVFTITEAIKVALEKGLIDHDQFLKIDEIRKFRNLVVHQPKKISQSKIEEKIREVKDIKIKMPDK